MPIPLSFLSAEHQSEAWLWLCKQRRTFHPSMRFGFFAFIKQNALAESFITFATIATPFHPPNASLKKMAVLGLYGLQVMLWWKSYYVYICKTNYLFTKHAPTSKVMVVISFPYAV